MFAPTKATVKLANESTGHVQGIGIFLCRFTNCSFIYLVVPVYYFPGNPYNKILSGALKCFVGFQKATSETLKHCNSVDPQVSSWISP